MRFIVSVCCLATLGGMMAGCAGAPSASGSDMRPGSWSVGDRPQMAFPGATRSEVKALAMGAARSRSWTIVESTEDRLVVQRSLDSGSSAARDLAASGIAPGSPVEVTSYFLSDRGGVKVALDAAVVSQAARAGRPMRTDVTETFRASLNESLRSLHDSWSQNRARLAQAAPPLGGGALAERDSEAQSQDSFARGDAASDVSQRHPAGWTNEAAAAVIEPDQAPAPSAPEPPAPRSAPGPVEQPVPTRVADTRLRPPAPEPRRSGVTPAPVVDASPVLSGLPTVATVQPMVIPVPAPDPPAAPLPLPSSENMVALYPASESVRWAYYAEQYARLRGCNVASQGSILIDSRSDGEIHKVPCKGTDAVLVQCDNGECRGLL